MRQRYGGPTLPKELRDQLGNPAHRGQNRRPRSNIPLNRKDRRKAEREAKKGQNQQPRKVLRISNGQHERHQPEQDDEDEETPPPIISPVRDTKKVPKGILKANTHSNLPPSPPPPPQVPRAVRDRLAQDDAEIAALEKRLGMKKKKKKKSKEDEGGLDEIFGDLGGFDSDEDATATGKSKRKLDQDDEWLAIKRQKALGHSVVEAREVSDSEGSSSDFDFEEVDLNEDSEVERGSGEGDDVEDGVDTGGSDFEGFDPEEDEVEKPRVRENPYVAPTTPGAQLTKYLPPALRAPPSSDTEALARLRRQIQGLLNRLSEANMMTILRDVEQIYQHNARGYVTTILIDLLTGLLADETTLLDTFLILHAGFIAAIYKVIGTDFGAQVAERIVFEFDKYYVQNKEGHGKQTTNLISVIAELYCFQVIGSNLVFDYIKLFLGELSEINTELLLRVVRVSGSQLRQDDPTSLKDIVLLLQKSVAKVSQNDLPVRTKFMIETINDLKNNKMKTGVAASAIASEHTIKMKKQLGTLNTRNLKGTEPLRIGLVDIRDTEKKGKWWLVGASWRNGTTGNASTETKRTHVDDFDDVRERDEDGEVNLFQLAREQRMNTDVRRAIFITVMSSSDYKEAHMRLLKLNLKKAQELEIPRVIVHCAGCEHTYNPYYTLLAKKFCTDHKSRKCFQFTLWDVFKSLGEKKDDADDDGSDVEDLGLEGEMSLRRLVNLGKLYGMLIVKGGLSITSLKPLNFPYLKDRTKTLIEVMLITIILESQKGAHGKRDEKALLNIFINADGATEMVRGLQYFLKKVVNRTEITANKKEKETVRWACKITMDMLERLMAATTLDED